MLTYDNVVNKKIYQHNDDLIVQRLSLVVFFEIKSVFVL